MVLIDANVLLDLVTGPNAWSDRSTTALRRAAATGPLFADDIVFAGAEVAGMGLLTRGGGRYRSHFPNVALIAPS